MIYYKTQYRLKNIILKWNIPLNEFFQNTEIENFYTIILKSAAGRIEPLSGPHLARWP